jgi:Uma2 family endonuclease
MAEPVKIRRVRDDPERAPRPADDLSEEPTLLRWVERPDGKMELRETPLTVEDFLHPQEGDHWVQGRRHGLTRRDLAQMLDDHFDHEPDVMVLEDVKHLLGPGLPEPAPDVSVVRGVKPYYLTVFDLVAEGVAPCLVIEIVSPKGWRIRRTDLEGKVEDYRRAGIPEYLIIDRPGRTELSPFHLLMYRRDSLGRYQRIEPDSQGRVLSETTGLWFSVPPEGDRVLVYDATTGERLLTAKEQREARRAAETQARREETARKTAEKKATREAEARKVAEKKAAREAETRKAAEEKAAREAEERKAAVGRAEAAEAELARLREEMRRLRDGHPAD